jgi:hypothetical protein
VRPVTSETSEDGNYTGGGSWKSRIKLFFSEHAYLILVFNSPQVFKQMNLVILELAIPLRRVYNSLQQFTIVFPDRETEYLVDIILSAAL